MKEFEPESPEALLAQFAAERDEGAFQRLVQRQLPFVYHAALRQLDGDHAAAQDVSIGVFTDLATKSALVAAHPSLAGWLFTATRQRTSNVRRDNTRRRLRESLAAANMHLTANSDPLWNELRPLIDDVLAELSDVDRAAVLGRYFEDQPHARLGARWGISENTARMRVERATDRLRVVLGRRGVTSTTTALGATLAGHAYCEDLPPGIAAQVIARALAGLAPSTTEVAAAAIGTGGAVSRGWSAAAGAAVIAILVALTITSIGRVNEGLSAVADNSAGPMIISSGPETTAKSNVTVAGESSPADLNRVTESGDFTLNILRLDFQTAAGAPIGDVRMSVHYYSPAGFGNRMVTNDARGMAIVEYPTNAFRLEIFTARDGWGDVAIRWDSARHETIPDRQLVVLEPGVRFGGVVTDINGQGIPGITVGFWGQHLEPEEKCVRPTLAVLKVVTDPAGHWECRRVANSLADRVDLSFHSPELTRDQQDKNEIYFGDRKQELAAATAGKHQAVMEPKSILVGRVIDELNQPIAGAVVAFLDPQAVKNCRNCPSAMTERDGGFRLEGREPGWDLVWAQASGWALGVAPIDTTGPTTIKLNHGRLLSFRIVDTEGRPIPAATLDRVTVHLDSVRSGELQCTLKSDAKGRISWTNAPRIRLDGQVFSPTHLRRKFSVSAESEVETAVALAPLLVLTGEAVDSETGIALPRFVVKAGVCRTLPGNSNVFWPMFANEMQTFTNGTYRADVHGSVNAVQGELGVSGVYFAFEADGYEPLFSELLPLDAGTVTLNPRLRRASTADIWIMDAVSHPVPSARVGLARSRSSFVLAGGRISLGRYVRPDLETFTTADQRGVFRGSSDPYVTRYVVTAPAGFACVDAGTARQARRIDLQPWGKVRGTIFWNGVPATGELIIRDGATFKLGGSTIDESASRAGLNKEGSFLISEIAPGTHIVQLSHGDQLQYLGEVVVRPGETTTFDFRPVFRPVAGKVNWPAALMAETGSRRIVVLETQNLLPTDSSNMNVAVQEWFARPEVQAAQLRQRRLVSQQPAPGQYFFPQVPPGRYELVAVITTGDSPNYHFRTSARKVFIVEAATSGEAFDAGEIDFSNETTP